MEEKSEERPFEELLEESWGWTERLEPGQKVTAVIVKITPEWAFLDLGGKSEGCLPTKEILDEHGQPTVKEGDSIQAYFLSAEHHERHFTTKISGGAGGKEILQEAYRSGIPVEGFVEKEIKGGYEVRLAGTTRAFCPYSQVGLGPASSGSDAVGRHVLFKIIEFSSGGSNIIVSHRVVAEEEQEAHKERLKATLYEGMTVRGKVTSVREFGAFVDLGGVQGLVPVSELGWGRTEDVHEVVHVGQEIEVVVIKIDWGRDRVTLSKRETMPDPWEEVAQRYPEGSSHTGKVSRLAAFGAFVTLGAGVDGLIHISKLGGTKRITHPREVVTVGESVRVRVESVDAERRRLSLSPVEEDQELVRGSEEHWRTYADEKPQSFGTLGDILKATMEKKKKKRSREVPEK